MAAKENLSNNNIISWIMMKIYERNLKKLIEPTFVQEWLFQCFWRSWCYTWRQLAYFILVFIAKIIEHIHFFLLQSKAETTTLRLVWRILKEWLKTYCDRVLIENYLTSIILLRHMSDAVGNAWLLESVEILQHIAAFLAYIYYFKGTNFHL